MLPVRPGLHLPTYASAATGMPEEQSFDPPTSDPTTASRASPTMCRTMPISRKTTPSPSCDGVLEADYVPEDEEIFWEAGEDYPADPEAAEDESHQEEEEVYAAYMDARRKLAKVRSARGYNRLSPSTVRLDECSHGQPLFVSSRPWRKIWKRRTTSQRKRR